MNFRLLILTLLVAPLAFGVEPPPASERWSRLQLGNITVYSNAGDRAARGVVDNIVRFRDTLAQVMRLSIRSPLPTNVYVFQNEASFAPYRNAALGRKSENVFGIFAQTAGANWVLIPAKSDLAFDGIVYHELTHYLIRNNVAGVPPWLDEGLAGFYETFAPIGKSDVVTIGKPPYKYLDALRASGLIPLRKLFAFRPPRSHKPDPQLYQFYMQSWLFLHYLLIGNPERGAGLGNYLALVSDGQPPERAFETAFGAKMEVVDGELAGYLRRDRFNMVQYSIKASATATGTPTAMPYDQVLFVLGELLARIEPSAGAETFLSESVKLNPNNAAALAELAGVKESLGKSADVEPLYERALELGDSDPQPYVQAALRHVVSMQQQARDGETVPAEQIENVRALANKALSLDPEHALANAVLGETYTFAGQDARKGIAASSRAFELSPAMTNVAADLVLLYARSGREKLARAMIDRFIVPAGEAELLAQATENLAVADYIRATELLRSKQNAEARMLLRRAGETTKNEKLKAKIVAANITASQ